MGVPVTVTDSSIDEFIRSYPFVVVDCYADWCKLCPAYSRMIDELAVEYDGGILFGKIEKDSNPETMRRNCILKVPTLIFYFKGRRVDRLVGYRSKNVVREWFTRVLRSQMVIHVVGRD